MMKDKSPDPYVRHLLPCPHTAQCIRLLDELDSYDLLRWAAPASSSSNGSDPGDAQSREDAQLAEQLATHIRSCLTCSVAVAHARRRRSQQRQALRDLLAEGETAVPATGGQIMAAIRREQISPLPVFAAANIAQQGQEETLSPGAISPLPQHPTRTRRDMKLRYIFSLAAVAVIILASVGIFSRFVLLRSTASSTQALATPAPLLFSNDWSSVIITRHSSGSGRQVVENYDPVSGKHLPLLATCCPDDTIIDGVEHGGHNMVYHRYDGKQTTYRLLSGQSYVVNGKGSNAIWSTDDAFLFVALADQIVHINVQTREQQKFPLNRKVDTLVSARDTFLYFTEGQALYRTDLSNTPAQLIANGAASSTFWLDPTGLTVYYVKNAGTQRDVYATKSNGSGSDPDTQPLLTNATPVGYAADLSLMAVRQVGGKFQLLKQDAATGQVIVLVKDMASGAISLCDAVLPADTVPICDGSLALSPFSKGLVVAAGYSDGSRKLLSIDVQTGRQLQILPLAQGESVQLIGWDKLLTK